MHAQHHPRLPPSAVFAPDIREPLLQMPRSFHVNPQLYTPGPSRRAAPPPRVEPQQEEYYYYEEDDDGDESDDGHETAPAHNDKGKGRLGGARAPGACDPCKQSKVKCVFPVPGQSLKCRRCEHGGHECRVSGRKQKPRPPSHEELLSKLREKDDVILGLLIHSTPSPDGASSGTTPPPLPPLPVWDKRTPKPEIERLVAVWIADARRRVGGVDPSPPRPITLESSPQPAPDILRTGMVTPHEVDILFRIFFDRINMFFTICDQVIHTPAHVHRTSSFLFTTICAVASRHYAQRPDLYPALLRAAKQAAGTALNGPKTVETCQAYLLLGVYHPPPRTFLEDRTFLFLGLAIRMATDLELHRPQTIAPNAPEHVARAALNRARVWLNCYCNDRSISTQLGKPSAIRTRALPFDLRRWWCSSPYSGPHDIHMCAYASLLGVVSGFHEVVVRAGEGEGQHLDLELVQTYGDKIDDVNAEWTARLAENSARNPHPATTWRDNLWPFIVSYAKLVVFSIGLQDGMRQGLRADNPFKDQCVEAATNLLTHVTTTLADLGYLRYCVEAYFVFMGFAAAFLLKILRPKFSFMMRPGRADAITALVQRLIDLLASDAISIDSRHTPRLYARFLATVLARHPRRATSAPAPAPAPSLPHAHPTRADTLPVAPQPYPAYAPPEAPTPQWMVNFFGSAPQDMEMDVVTDPGGVDDMMLHSMSAITDPRFWEQATMPGFSWAGGGGGGGGGAQGGAYLPAVDDGGFAFAGGM